MFQKDYAQVKIVVQKPKSPPLVLENRNPDRFTIGPSIKSSYTLDNMVFEDQHQLIKRRGKKYFLMVPPGVQCEILGGQSKRRVYLETLIAFEFVKKVGNAYAVPFIPGSRAILRMGEVVLGVEYTAPPKEKSLAPLPLPLRFSPFSKSDLIFFFILLLSFSSSFFSIWQIKKIQFPEREIYQILPKRYAKLIFELPIETRELFREVLKEKEKEKEAKKKEAKKPKKKSAKPAKKNIREQGLLGYIERQQYAENVLGSDELKKVFQGVGVLTKKGPQSRNISGPRLAYRDTSSMDDLVAGIAGQTSASSGLGRKKTVKISNPFDVEGRGSQHALRSFQEIDRVIRRHLLGIRYLYERYLRGNPLLQGRVTLRFVIDANGRVSQCKVISSSMKNDAFEGELVKRIRLWKFPSIEAKAGSVSVVYPFTFLPKGD